MLLIIEKFNPIVELLIQKMNFVPKKDKFVNWPVIVNLIYYYFVNLSILHLIIILILLGTILLGRLQVILLQLKIKYHTFFKFNLLCKYFFELVDFTDVDDSVDKKADHVF